MYPTRNLNSSDMYLIWPIACELGVNCSLINYPDIFDGKFDRCQSFGSNAVYNNPDCSPPAGAITAMDAGKSSGYQVCTDASDAYCNDQQKQEGGRGCFWCFRGGNVVVILHPNNPFFFATRYDHLKRGSILVKPGDRVVRGQKIAQVGSAGRSSGPHLHFEVWTDWYKPVDPWPTNCSLPGGLWQYIIDKIQSR